MKVKAEENLIVKNPNGFGICISMSDYRVHEKLVDLPLYAISLLWEVREKTEYVVRKGRLTVVRQH